MKSFAKNLSFLCCVLIFLAGLLSLAIGTYLLVPFKALTIDTSVIIALFSFGGVMLLIALLGTCGVIHTSKVLLSLYIFVLVAVMIAEIAFGTYGYVKQPDSEAFLKDWWNSSYATNQRALVDVELFLDCCGFYNTTDMAYPATCARDRNVTYGCFQKLHKQSKDGKLVAGISLAVVSGVEVLALIAAVWLISITGRRVYTRRGSLSSDLEEHQPFLRAYKRNALISPITPAGIEE